MSASRWVQACLPDRGSFVAAAGVIRREVDAQHVDYGDAAGYYAKIPSATIVREAWTAHLEGRTSREDALARIVDKVVAERQAK